MSEYTKTQLGNYLGVWKYSDEKGVVKYWRVVPDMKSSCFIIHWGRTERELDAAGAPKLIIEDSTECYNRILSKARGGYIRYIIFGGTLTPKCYDEFNSIGEVLASEDIEARKRKPRKRKLSLLDWMSGLEEYRENEKE